MMDDDVGDVVFRDRVTGDVLLDNGFDVMLTSATFSVDNSQCSPPPPPSPSPPP